MRFCFDCDNYDSDHSDKKFVDEAKKYGDEKGYRFVWFSKEIESLYLGEQIEDRLKAKATENFA